MLQNCIQTLLFTVERSCAENGFKHFLRACGVFDHSSLRCKVSTENSDASVGSDCLVIWTDDIFLCKVYIVTFVKFLKPFVAFLIKSVVLQLLKVFS